MTVDRDRAERSRTDVPVLIVGAGPTGLVLALWLTRLGVAVRIIDKTAEPGTTSRALAVSRSHAGALPPGRAGRRRSSRAASRSRAPTSGSRAPRSHGCRCERIGEGLTPFPFALIFPQDAHERVLIERLDALGVKVERRTELVRFDQRARRRAGDAQAGRRLRGDLRGGLSRRLRRGAFDRQGGAGDRLPRRDLFRPLLRRRRGGVAARRRTARSTSISTGPTSWPSFP